MGNIKKKPGLKMQIELN